MESTERPRSFILHRRPPGYSSESNPPRERHRKQPVSDAKWPKGERGNRLTGIAGAMRKRGLSPEALEAALLAANFKQCDPPLDDIAVKRIAKSVSEN